MLEEARDTGEIIERVAALDIGKAELVCCVRVPDAARPGRRLQEVTPYSTMTRSLLVHGGPAARPGRDPGGDGSHVGVLEGAVLPAGSGGIRGLAGQRQRRQTSTRAAQNGQARRRLVVQGRRTADDPAQFRPAARDPPAAGSDPLPDQPGRGAQRGEAAGGEAARRRPDQAQCRGQ